jgi:uncharacterized ferredoxin-like protein
LANRNKLRFRGLSTGHRGGTLLHIAKNLLEEPLFAISHRLKPFFMEVQNMKILETVGELMELAARTAPKSAGQDFVVTKMITGGDVSRLADEMVKYGVESGKKNFDRDGENVRNSSVVVLVGLKDTRPVGLNCGACGTTCEKIHPSESGEFAGPQCAFRLLDMGIALGSAAKTAQLHNADSRIIYRIGVAARKMGLVDWDICMGIPLSATGKNIYFDRPVKS